MVSRANRDIFFKWHFTRQVESLQVGIKPFVHYLIQCLDFVFLSFSDVVVRAQTVTISGNSLRDAVSCLPVPFAL